MCKPDPKLKGIEGGNCNRTACQEPHAVWFNESTRAWYCLNCAVMIQRHANDYAKQCQEPPLIMFKGVFDSTTRRQKSQYI